MSKTITKLCPSCKYFYIDDNHSLCKWGKRKKRKVLKDDRVRKTCNLIRNPDGSSK